jgi:inorganic pyrophosphatase
MTPAETQEFCFAPVIVSTAKEQDDKMTDYLALPLGEGAPNTVTAVIEVAHRKATKYDRHSRLFRPVKPLFPPIHLPGNYGFIPQTLCANGEPLGILMLGDVSTDPGCIRRGRPIGALEIVDHGVQLEKIVACAVSNPRFHLIHNYTDAQPNLLLEIEHVLSRHRDFRGKRIMVLGWKDRRAAQESIRACHARFVSHEGEK